MNTFLKNFNAGKLTQHRSLRRRRRCGQEIAGTIGIQRLWIVPSYYCNYIDIRTCITVSRIIMSVEV